MDTYRNDDAEYIELTMPIIESETQNVIGVFLVRATTAGVFSQQRDMDQAMWIMISFLSVLMLVYVQELSIKAAAETLCRKEETVRKQLQRGKKLLIERCKEEGMCLD